MTDTFKGTPGPWETATEHRKDLGVDHIWIAPASWLPRVARVVVYPEVAEEERANARLIAAAPDLLEALQMADAALSGANMDMKVVERKARAAIAKALGTDK